MWDFVLKFFDFVFQNLDVGNGRPKGLLVIRLVLSGICYQLIFPEVVDCLPKCIESSTNEVKFDECCRILRLSTMHFFKIIEQLKRLRTLTCIIFTQDVKTLHDFWFAGEPFGKLGQINRVLIKPGRSTENCMTFWTGGLRTGDPVSDCRRQFV